MFNSKNYWEDRYFSGQNSGNGSYGFLADYKSEIINDFIKKNNIKSLLEYGCGDGNQLSKIKCEKIIGVDVSKTAINKCKNTLPQINFFLLDNDNFNFEKTELLLSLDVLYHLVEDDVYEKYIDNIIKHDSNYIIIYSSDFEDNFKFGNHVKHRKFTKKSKLLEKYELLTIIKNKYPSNDHKKGSFSDWFIFKKI